MVRLSLVCLCLAGSVIASTLPAFAHPTDRELREAWEEQQRCQLEVAPADRIDPIRLGMNASELRGAVKGLHPYPLAGSHSKSQLGLSRLVREARGELAKIEYELWHDQVYLIRWRLGNPFERPIMNELGQRGRACFGPPDYDQTIEAEPGSPTATLRRIGWTHGDRRIELRQLHPLRGGPVYLSISLDAVLHQIGAAGVARFPEPDRSGPWWQRTLKAPAPVQAEEQKRLGQAFVGLLSQLDH